MSSRAQLVATLTRRPDGRELERLGETTDWLEVRADLVGEIEAEELRRRYPGRLLYTLRSAAEGGCDEASSAERHQRLARAGAAYDLVDLEARRDLEPAVLAAVPAERRLLSWHGPAVPLPELSARAGRMLETPARWYKLVPSAASPGEELRPLALLRSLGRDDVVAFAGGRMGAWTRLLAPRLGGALVYGAAFDDPAAPGQPTVDRLRRDYGLPDLPPAERCFGIVGNPVGHSLSPRLHNGAYRALGVPAVYLAFEPPGLGDFWLEVVERGSLSLLGLPLQGLSVTAPFKEVAAVVAGATSPLADQLSSANTLIERDGVWEADTTDPAGVVDALAERGVDPAGRRAVVVGCGGAGRAAAAGLSRAGAEVTLVNRSAERGRAVARQLRLPFIPLAEFAPGGFDVLVNATSLGHGADDPLPFEVAATDGGAVIVDLVYRDGPTALLEACRAAGRRAVDGRSVLLFQALGQFEGMTGRELPVELGRELLGLGGEPG